jgi:hypothetical protein
MLDALKSLMDSGVLTEQTHAAINEAWEAKLTEAREQIRTEIREEFAGRYEHDKKVMVEAIDRMVTEALQAEIAEFQQDKKAIAEQRVRVVEQMNRKGAQFEKFMTQKLAEEIMEFRRDRQQMQEAVKKLENFVFTALAEEIAEFAQDKRQVVETRVRLVAEAREQLSKLKKQFVARSSRAVAETVTRHLTKELSQLREDITAAKNNNFGRKIFEAFASEFSNSQLNENAELRKLYRIIEKKDALLAESNQIVNQKQSMLEQKEVELRSLISRNERANILSELLSPLSKDRQKTMKDLLEGVQTSQLRNAFEKYLPAVLNEDRRALSSKRAVITEGISEVTGNKTAKSDDTSNIIDIKRLAGI